MSQILSKLNSLKNKLETSVKAGTEAPGSLPGSGIVCSEGWPLEPDPSMSPKIPAACRAVMSPATEPINAPRAVNRPGRVVQKDPDSLVMGHWGSVVLGGVMARCRVCEPRRPRRPRDHDCDRLLAWLWRMDVSIARLDRRGSSYVTGPGVAQ